MKGFVIILVFLFSSCARDIPNPNYPPIFHSQLDTLKILWKDTLSSNFTESIEVFSFKDQVYHSISYNNSKSRIISHNKLDGSLKWKSEELGRLLSGFERNAHPIEDGLLINIVPSELIRLDLETGLIDWQSVTNSTITSFLLNNNYLTSRKTVQGDSIQLLITDASSGQTEVLFSISKEGNRVPELRTFGGYMKTNGDEVVLAGVTFSTNSSGIDYSTKVYSFNLSTNTLEWITSDLDTTMSFGNLLNTVNSLKVDVDKGLVYIIESKHVYAVDLDNGNVVWHRFFPETNMLTSNSVIYDGDLVWVDDLGYIISLEGQSGLINYRKSIEDAAPSQLVVWNDKAVAACGDLKLIDLQNGVVLGEAYLPPSGPEQLFSPPYIDEDLNRIFVTDGYAIICAEIPDTWYE